MTGWPDQPTEPRWVGLLVALIVAAMITAGALAYAVYEWSDGPEFNAADWHDARAKDAESLDDLAADAVESGDLIGKTRPELRRMLGAPDQVTERRRAWEWDIGYFNDAIGPGDGGTLRIHFDRETGRSVKATAGF